MNSDFRSQDTTEFVVVRYLYCLNGVNKVLSILSFMSDSSVKGFSENNKKRDRAIHRINHYPEDKYLGNQLHYPLDRDLSDG